MMVDASRILTTKVISPVQGYDRGTGSLHHEDVGHLGRERTLSVGQRVRVKGGGEQRSARDGCCYRAVDLSRVGPGLHGLRDVGDLYETRTGRSVCIHCMAGIAIYADVAGNGSRLHRIGRNAGTPGMGASLTAFRFPAA
jgi:hypothetical protein